MTTLPDGLVVDPITGELVTPEHLATIYANAVEALAELDEQRHAVQADIAILMEAVRPLAEAGPLDAGRDRKVVLRPPKRPAQRVSAQGAERHREVLIDMGIGRVEEVFRAPTISVVRERSAELVARGIPLEEIAPEPIPGPPTLEIVTLGGSE